MESFEIKVMRKALELSSNITDNTERAKEIIKYIDFAGEMYGDLKSTGINLSDNQTNPLGAGLNGPGQTMGKASDAIPADALMKCRSEAIPEPPAMPRRIVHAEPKRDIEYRTTEEISDWVQRAAPTTITVPIAGGQPMILRRDVKTRQELNMVRLSYIPAQGDDDPVFTTFMTSDENLELDRRMLEIQQAVAMKYSAKTRKIEPRTVPAQSFSLANSIGGEAEENAGDYLRNPEATERAREWSNSRTPEELAFIRGSR